MKNLSQILLVWILVFGFMPTKTFAQAAKGESVITAGVGMSILNLAVSINSAQNNNIKASSIPTLNFMYDFALIDNFSMGVAVGYNSISITEDYESFISPGIPITYKTDALVTRINIGLRPLYHWGKRDEVDWHMGIRLGYSIWDESVTTNDPNYDSDYRIGNFYSFQALFGTRVYFSDKMGMTFDIGLGTPYFAGIGMTMKL